MIVKILVGALVVLYPLAIYFGLRVFDVKTLGLCLLAVLLLRLYVSKASLSGQLVLVTVVGCLLASAIILTNDALYLQLYPVLMNTVMLVAFLASLRWPPSMIERFARLSEPDLDADGVAYTRRVTMIWSGFFLVNGLVALWTVLEGTLEQWTLYNGLIAYLLMGALMGGEYCVRVWVKRKKGVRRV